jgi:hypothetical protein
MDDLRKTSPCGFKLNICLQNTEIDAAIDTEVISECKINENFIGTDPWELDFYEAEKGELTQIEAERQKSLDVKKQELEEKQRQREEDSKRFNLILAAVGIMFLIVVLVILYK